MIRAHAGEEANRITLTALAHVSDDASYVTGQTLSADGGHWMLG